MLNINKLVTQEHADPTVHDHLMEHPWTKGTAIDMVRKDGLDFTDNHLAIIRYLRDCYADGTVNARILMQSLEEEFAGLGGHKFLSKLFPLGPIAQASRYVWLPMQPGTRDPSFSTNH